MPGDCDPLLHPAGQRGTHGSGIQVPHLLFLYPRPHQASGKVKDCWSSPSGKQLGPGSRCRLSKPALLCVLRVSNSVSDLSASGHGTHLCVYLSLPVKRTPSPWMLSRLVTPNHRFRFVEKGRQAGRLTSHLGKAADPTVLTLQLLFPCGLWRSQCVYS